MTPAAHHPEGQERTDDMTKQEVMAVSDPTQHPTGLALLRLPFPPHQISKLPKPTKAQTDAVKADFKVGIRCQLCGAWHHKDVVHLDYVGHAALTDRLLDCDPFWNWEPVASGSDGTPAIDAHGGMWIKLTVCGVTRMGYGHAVAKQNDAESRANAMKELIGDALRNAAMRFGAALDLWHKGDLHGDDDASPIAAPPKKAPPAQAMQDGLTAAWEDGVLDSLPENASPREKAEAFANSICEGFKGKGHKALDNEWTRREKIIEGLRAKFPDLYAQVEVAYNARRDQWEAEK
jgi:hypothetical protein